MASTEKPISSDNAQTELEANTEFNGQSNQAPVMGVKKHKEKDGYDNEAFEDSTPRRVSLSAEKFELAPRKSILHTSSENVVYNQNYNDDKSNQLNGTRAKKISVTDSVYSKQSRAHFSDIEDERSWWYLLCLSCRNKETTSSWQPPGWQKVCPHPFCPSYRSVARMLALILVGLLTWGVVYAIVGDMAAPGGQLFGLALLAIIANFGGWLITLTTLPALIGMLLTGILLQNVGLVHIEGEFLEVTAILRKIALVIILIRAGLDLDPEALRRLKFIVLRIALIPWFAEAIILTILGHYLLELPWVWGFLLGSIISAVAPAVVVPCLFRLRGKGYGVAKGIPTLIIAVSGIDDAMSVALFGIVSSVMFSSDSLLFQILQGPISIFGGIGFGVFWGWLAQYIPEKDDPFVVPLRILMLLGGGLIAVFGSELIGYEGAGPLGCITAAFFCSLFWSKQGWQIDENPVATAFEIFWMIFEPILFSLTGAQVKINELEPHTVAIGAICLATCCIIRIFVTVLVGIRAKLNLKEKFFVAFAWMAKATVQAALGPVALDLINPDDPVAREYAEKVLVVCILSIILTAPTGAIMITLTGPRLLTKTKIPPIMEGWRRSHRPSIRDISIMEEDDDTDNPEKIINHINI